MSRLGWQIGLPEPHLISHRVAHRQNLRNRPISLSRPAQPHTSTETTRSFPSAPTKHARSPAAQSARIKP
jgi:hypothetical protein